MENRGDGESNDFCKKGGNELLFKRSEENLELRKTKNFVALEGMQDLENVEMPTEKAISTWK